MTLNRASYWLGISAFTWAFALSGAVFAQGEPGFKSGPDYFSTNLYGSVTAFCHDPNSVPPSMTFDCSMNILEPGEYDRFTASIDANQVVLLAHREDGSTQEKTVSFDPAQGESKPVNLWIRTLFQKPLLKAGANRVEYTFKKDGRVVLQGETQVSVKQGQSRQCQHQLKDFYGGVSCTDRMTICSAYFRDGNDCQ